MKRFTDTDIWGHKWFRALDPEIKCLWFYLKDNCDAAGVWEIDFDAAQFETKIKTKLTVNLLKNYFQNRVSFFTFENREFLILTGFISFQISKELNPNFHPHKPVLQSINKFSLIENNRKFYSKLTVNLQLQDIDKDKEEDKDNEKEKEKGIVIFSKSDVIFSDYISKFNEVRNTNFKKLPKKAESVLQESLKTYSVDEIIIAYRNACMDKFHVESCYKHLTPEFFTRIDKIEKFLNYIPENQIKKHNNPTDNTFQSIVDNVGMEGAKELFETPWYLRKKNE